MTGPQKAERKLRLLCLHGYLQNEEMFRSRLGSWRKGLRSRAEFFFMDAPYTVEHPSAAEAAEADGVQEAYTEGGGEPRSWWRWTDVEPDRQRPSRARTYQGWEASQDAISAALEQHAPIDGLLGFSQGASAAALYLAKTALTGQPAGPRGELRFAILAAGFLPNDESFVADLRRGATALPTLFVYGAADDLVPLKRTQGLWETFAPGATQQLQHGGGHMVPTCSGTTKAALLHFLDAASSRQSKQEVPPPQLQQENGQERQQDGQPVQKQQQPATV